MIFVLSIAWSAMCLVALFVVNTWPPGGWRWRPGRQGTGYRKLLLAQGRRWDLYLLDYPVGSYVPPHTDPADGKRHHRLNVRIWGEDTFRSWDIGSRIGERPRSGSRFVLFRPDELLHAVDASPRRRVLLSLGWVTR